MTFRDWLYTWLDRRYLKAAYGRRRTRSSTEAKQRQRLETFVLPVLGDMLLVDITPGHCRGVVERMRDRAPHTVNLVTGLMSSVFAAAVYERLVDRNPCEHLERQRVVRDPKNLPALDEVARLLPDGPQRRLCTLLLYTGMRLREALDLQVGEVDVERCEIRLSAARTKEVRAKTVAYPALLNTTVFAAEHDGVRWWTFSESHVRAYLRRIGLHPHALRHIWARRAAELTQNLVLVQRHLGHASIQTTQGYLQHSPPGTRALVESVAEGLA